MKTKEIKYNRVENATLTEKSKKLYDEFNSLQLMREQIRNQKTTVKTASDSLIDENYERILEKFNAKVPYLVRKDGKHRNGMNRRAELVACDKIFAITERGVIFRIKYQVTGKQTTYRCALEISHEQMSMSDGAWNQFVAGYRAYIAAEYPYKRREREIPMSFDGISGGIPAGVLATAMFGMFPEE